MAMANVITAGIVLNDLITESIEGQWADIALTSEQLMDIYVGAFVDEDIDESDEMPPIVLERCPDCLMKIGDLEEHDDCIRR